MPSADSTAAVPKHQSAIIAQSLGKASVQHDVPIHSLAADEVLVKTAAVAINPVDVKALDYAAAPGCIMGTDFAGTIVALGADAAAAGRLAVGDRVAGSVCGMSKTLPDVGAFAQYIGAQAAFCFKLPDNVRFEDAAPLGLAVATAMYALFSELGLPTTLDQLESTDEAEKPGDVVLVAGGSTATGTRAIQMLKTAGYRPIATASPANFDLCTRFGAEKVFDYRSPSCADDIKAYTRRSLYFVLDCVTEAETTQLCYAVIGRAGGRYVALEPFRESITRSRAGTVEASWFNVRIILGQEEAEGPDSGREASPEDLKFGKRAFAIVQKLLDSGAIDTHPVKVMPGGLEGALQGLAQIRKQAPSGQKLVYMV